MILTKKHRALRWAVDEASKSVFKRARVGAVISKGHRIISTGHNYIGHCSVVDRPYIESTHAEVAAIAKLIRGRRWDDLIHSTLYIARIGRDGVLRLSRPCGNCSELIRAVGIKRVIYTIDNDTVGVWDVRSNQNAV